VGVAWAGVIEVTGVNNEPAGIVRVPCETRVGSYKNDKVYGVIGDTETTKESKVVNLNGW